MVAAVGAGQHRCSVERQQQPGGSLPDFMGSIDDHGAKQPSCYEFKSRGAGCGLCGKNESASHQVVCGSAPTARPSAAVDATRGTRTTRAQVPCTVASSAA